MGAYVSPARKAAAVRAYRRGGRSLRQVAKRHGVSHGRLAVWLKPSEPPKPRNPWMWDEAEVALTDGRWTPNHRGVLIWEPTKPNHKENI